MEKTVECQLNAFYGTSFFIAFYNDDSAVPSVTSNRYHAIACFILKQIPQSTTVSRLGKFVMVSPLFSEV